MSTECVNRVAWLSVRQTGVTVASNPGLLPNGTWTSLFSGSNILLKRWTFSHDRLLV
jgi:hypothetical protein